MMMSQYIYAWIAVAVLAALSELLIPGGKSGKLAGHIRFLTGLCLVVAFLPAAQKGVSLFQDIKDMDLSSLTASDQAASYQTDFQNSLQQMTQEACESWVYSTLEETFSVKREDCTVVAAVASDGQEIPEITSVSIMLRGQAIKENPHSIEAYIEGKLSVPCTVSVELFG